MRLRILGISGGSFAHTRAGVNPALILFSIKHAFDNGFCIFDHGYSAPFRSDGVLRFKETWGVRHVADRDSELLSWKFRDPAAEERFVRLFQPLRIEDLEVQDPPP
jgi:hypothetical protein